MSTSLGYAALLFWLLLFQVGGPSTSRSSPSTGCQTTELAEYDAEMLLYLLPSSEAVRRAGGKVAWEIESGTNQKDFYSFYVYDLKGSPYGSPTIGHFAVNKHTGEVWDAVTEEPVESEDLSAIERIIRKGHCIDDNVLKTYSSSKPDVLPK
jgi:hypothetical protein